MPLVVNLPTKLEKSASLNCSWRERVLYASAQFMKIPRVVAATFEGPVGIGDWAGDSGGMLSMDERLVRRPAFDMLGRTADSLALLATVVQKSVDMGSA